MEVSVYKPTNDDWFDNFEIKDGDQLVEVMFSKDPDSYKRWVITVSGKYKTYMNRDFDNETIALNTYMQIIGWDTVDQEILKENGFEFGE